MTIEYFRQVEKAQQEYLSMPTNDHLKKLYKATEKMLSQIEREMDLLLDYGDED